MNNKIFYIFIFCIVVIVNNTVAVEHYAVIKLPQYDLLGKEQYIDLAKADITDKIIDNIFRRQPLCSNCKSKQASYSGHKVVDSCLLTIICEYADDTRDMKIVFDEQYAKSLLKALSEDLQSKKFCSIAAIEDDSSFLGLTPTKAYNITLRELDEFIRDTIDSPSHTNKASLFTLIVNQYIAGLNNQQQLVDLQFKAQLLRYNTVPQSGLPSHSYPELK